MEQFETIMHINFEVKKWITNRVTANLKTQALGKNGFYLMEHPLS